MSCIASPSSLPSFPTMSKSFNTLRCARRTLQRSEDLS
jgi:hypothetical protein